MIRKEGDFFEFMVVLVFFILVLKFYVKRYIIFYFCIFIRVFLNEKFFKFICFYDLDIVLIYIQDFFICFLDQLLWDCGIMELLFIFFSF